MQNIKRFTLALSLIITLLFLSCDLDTPSNPEWNNPLDEFNVSTEGDPYQLSAEIVEDGVQLTWQVIDMPAAMLGYNIYRKVDDGESVQLAQVNKDVYTYIDSDIVNIHRYEYLVVARFPGGEADKGKINTAWVHTSPIFFIETDTSEYTPSRDVTLTIQAFGAVKTLLSNSLDFTGIEWEDYAETKPWRLTTGDSLKTVYLRIVYADEDTSDVITDSIEPAPINPSVSINHDAQYTPTRYVRLTLSGTGVDSVLIENVSERRDGKKRSIHKVSSLDDSNSEWIAYTDSLDWILPIGGGEKSVKVRMINDFLIEAECTDLILPQLAQLNNVTISSGVDTVQTNFVNVRIDAEFADSMQVNNSEDFSGSVWVPYQSDFQWDLGNGIFNRDDISQRLLRHTSVNPFPSRDDADATGHVIFARVKNDFEVLSGTMQDDVTVEILGGVTINNGADSTASRYVTLKINAPEADYVAISNDSATLFNNPEWIEYKDEIQDWQLNTGSGTKTVYTRFRNVSGAESVLYTDTIEPIPIDPSITIENGVEFTSTRKVTVALSASSVIDSIQVSVYDDFHNTDWIECSEEVEIELLPGVGAKVVYARFVNDFEIESEIVSDSIEPLPMNPTLVIENGTEYTSTRAVTISLSASGVIDSMQVSVYEDFHNTEWIVYSEEVNVELIHGDGEKVVYARFVNDFEIESEVVSDAIQPLPIDPSLSIVDEDEDGYTAVRLVELSLSAQGENLRMMLSEDPDFEGADWIEYEETPQFELSVGAGEKVVYAKFINDFEIESEVVSDTISPLPMNPSITIDGGAEYTQTREVSVNISANGVIDSIQVSVYEDFNDAIWVDYSDETSIELLGDDGVKIVYAQLVNDFEIEVKVSDTITLDTYVEISEFRWSSEGDGPFFIEDIISFELLMHEDYIGAEIGGIATVSIEDVVDGIELDEVGNGRYELDYEIPDDEWVFDNIGMELELIVHFTDRGGNRAESINEELLAIGPHVESEYDFYLTDDVSITMVWIPAGEFVMGEPNEHGGHNDEEPEHDVVFESGFWMGKYEITQAQWEAVMGENPAHDYGVGDDYPVYLVNWNDIQDFEETLDHTFRLPSESEWEYACRAGTQTDFYWGDDEDYEDIDDYAVYRDNDPDGAAEIGTKDPNDWNLYDMSGNVREFSEDRWHWNYEGAPDDGSAWLQGGHGAGRVYRGGSYSDIARECRSGYRMSSNDQSIRSYAIGFRLVRDTD
ncbi:MAG: formylglycine-generating enzyme family protein [Candidatus Hatepunaea meridiana]|nr:formylglycine-generating enzyme family protein [Candidatus Hatepunaea meridiana]